MTPTQHLNDKQHKNPVIDVSEMYSFSPNDHGMGFVTIFEHMSATFPTKVMVKDGLVEEDQYLLDINLEGLDTSLRET